MAQVSFKIGNLTDLSYLSKVNGQFIVAKDAAAKRAEIYVDVGTGANDRLRVGDFESYPNLEALQAAYAGTGTKPSTSKMYYIQDTNVLAVYDSVQDTFVQVNGAGVTNVVADGSGDYITGFSYDSATGVLTLTEGTLDADDVLYKAGTGGAEDIKVGDALDDLYEAIGAGGSVAQQIAAAIGALDGTATIASESSGVVTLKAGITETDGVVANNSSSDITLAKVATTGEAVDVSYGSNSTVKAELDKLEGNDATAGSIAKSIKDAIEGLDVAEFALASENNDIVTIKGIKEVDGEIAIGDGAGISLGTAAKATKSTTAIAVGSTDAGLVSAQQVATFVAAEIAGLEGAMHFVGVIERQTGETDAQAIARTITSPKAGDTVVMSDNAKEYIYVNSTAGWREVGDETEFVKKTTTIAGVDLQDNITQSELQTALGLGTAAYEATSAFDAAGAADTALSTAIGTSEDASTANTIYGAKAYADSLAGNYEAAGTAAGLIAALDADLDASGTAQHSGTFVVSGVTEVDGVLTAVDSVEVEAAGAAAALAATLGTAAYTDSTAYDAAGAAAAVLGTSSDTATANTVYGAKAAAAAAQGEVDALETYVGTIPGTATATDVIGYVDEKVASSILEWGTFSAPSQG